MKSTQVFVFALVLVCAVVTQVESSNCPQKLIDAMKAMQTACVSEDVNIDDVTEQEQAAIQECFIQESQKHDCFDNINAKCNSEKVFEDKLMCFQIQLGKASCGPKDFIESNN